MPETVIHWHIIPKENIPLPKNWACLEMVIDDLGDTKVFLCKSVKINQMTERNDTLSDKTLTNDLLKTYVWVYLNI